ncbi:methyltransferase domain-containing protein [Pisolithus microcarpus]|nr:methyltransferase domain-containing protein [Pisolithus microcarpus]
MLEIYDRIASPLATSLLTTHPNQVTLDGRTPDLWSSWLGWAAEYDQELPKWQQLLSYYCRPTESPTESASLETPESVSPFQTSLPSIMPTIIPAELRLLIDTVRNLQLSRESACVPVPASHSPHVASKTRGRSPSSFGMSPKKEHEVTRMATFIHNILNRDPRRRNAQHVVDVGSGQGYLSRALQERGLHVLALDNNANQTSGANNWKIKDALRRAHEQRRNNTQDIKTGSSQTTPSSHSNGSLTHRTVHIKPTTLEAAIEDWLLANVPDTFTSSRDPIPIMFVALHACGSLTVDVLRTFLSRHSKAESGRWWEPHSLVVVGCCYNLITPSGMRLFQVSASPYSRVRSLHLATQVPTHWFRTEKAGMGACLAVRKVVYRALLQPVIQLAAQCRKESTDSQEIMSRENNQELTARLGLGETPENRRLGKLNDTSYTDWSTFLVSATTKLGISVDDLTQEGVFERLRMESRLEVVYVLRCILGPLIESLILLDRYEWLREELGGGSNCRTGPWQVEMVNLFDQVTGSGRNVALVVSPYLTVQTTSLSGCFTEAQNAVEPAKATLQYRDSKDAHIAIHLLGLYTCRRYFARAHV